MELRCPKCQRQLERQPYEGVFIFLCPAGHGHWLGQAELRQIVLRREHKVPAEIFEEVKRNLTPHRIETRSLPEDVRCPVCGALCEKVNYAYSSGIIIDHCPNGCGVWLDSGELEKIQAFVEIWDQKALEVALKLDLGLDDYRKDMQKYRGGILSTILDSILGWFIR